MRYGFLYAWCLVPIALNAGCNRESLDLAPVHGIVSVDGKPLFQGKVMFAPVAKGDNTNPGKPAWSHIQPNGAYRLTTHKANDGAVVGEHWATIINSEEKLPKGVPNFSRFIVPKKMLVAAGKDNQIDIELTNEIIKENREDDR